MRGVLGVEVTDDGVSLTAFEILDTGAKIPIGHRRQYEDGTSRALTFTLVHRS